MKILSIAGRNLNSLRVEFKVDFTCGPLKDCGIFAITGPTGAGKTTLLDAITLALYGKTPRSAKDDDIISYGSGEAWAEVVFQTPEGVFRSEWKVRRARNKYDGALQQSSMEVSTYPEGRILTHKKKDAQDKVRELIKLEYDQFLKSVLLAQGAFKAFLDTRDIERGEMLEKISDTSLYTYLSKKAFERKRKEEQALHLLQASIGNLVLLGIEERTTYENRMQELKEAEKNGHKELEELRLKFNWLKSRDDLTKKHSDAESEVALSRERLKTEQANLDRWDLHLQVAGFEPEWMQYLSKVQECLLQKQNIQKLKERLSLLTDKKELAETALKSAQDLATEAMKHREERMPRILEAITRQKDRVFIGKELEKIHEKRKAKILEGSECTAKIHLNKAALTKNKETLEELKNWFNKHAYYSEAGDSCTKASILVNQLTRSLEDIESYQTAILKGKKQIEDASEQRIMSASMESEAVNELNLNLELRDKTSKQLSQLRHQLVIHLKESTLEYNETIVRIEKQQNLLSRQQFLVDHLSRLHEGEACPLCGSTDHPNQTLTVKELKIEISTIEADLAKRQLVLKTYGQRQKTIEKLISNLDDFEVPEEEAETEALPKNFESIFYQLMQLSKLLPQKQHEASQKRSSAIQLQKSLAENIIHFNTEKLHAETKLQRTIDKMEKEIDGLREISVQFQLNFDKLTPGNLPKTLEKYSKEYQQKIKEESLLQGSIPGIEAGIETLNEQIMGLKQYVSDLQIIIDEKNATIFQYDNEIKEAHTGYPSPEAARDNLNANEKLAYEQAKKASELLNAILQETGKILGEKDNAATACEELELSIKKLKNNLEDGLQNLGWETDIELIRQRLLLGGERTMLEKLYKSLHERLVLSLAHFETCKKHLEHHLLLNITDEDGATIDEKIKQVQEAIRDINHELGRISRVLAEDEEKKARLKEVRLKIAAQEEILLKWATLSDLIGSADGKKFNQFAQGLTLDRLLLLANHHLQLLNDRYLLKRNAIQQGLQLLIIDRYQADNEREINTLSGGESFLVSLALALGLSEMTSKLTTIDSLFIDEGFGTLDADTLEVALNALRGLQIGGKTIGIISHVERLKEEIYTQVEITKGSDGFSSLHVIP